MKNVPAIVLPWLLLTALQPSMADGGEVDAIEARLITEDAERFAKLFAKGGDVLSAGSLQRVYLDLGTEGIEIFMGGRIKSADNLAEKVAANYDVYARGVDVCLPAAQKASSDLRAVYLAYEGLLEDPQLPEAYAVFGANNSGGTIGGEPGDFAIVIGLEVVCRLAEGDSNEVRQWLKNFFAHEVAHTQQSFPANVNLLSAILVEGAADFIGEIIAGQTLNDKLETWARPREEEIWDQFLKDMNKRNLDSFSPWLYDENPKNGWPMDVGYWLGAQIAAAYFEKASDKRQAIRDILDAASNPEAFLEASGYAQKFD